MAALKELQPLVQNFQTALYAFISSPSSFRVLATLSSSTAFYTPVKTLYVLDSSFNPPTLAHLRIAISALSHDNHANSSPTKRLLLLLATQNADKAPKPANFDQRLAMMTLFADELVQCMRSLDEENGRRGGQAVVIDVGVTKSPLYLDKASVMDQSGQYGEIGSGPEQVHLTGFDSLIRLLDPKYYPPNHNLQPLESFFSKHRIRATRRTDDKWGGRNEQDAYLKALADGERESEGGNAKWASRIDLVEGRQEGEEIISSTKVRIASKSRDRDTLEKLVPRAVADFVLQEKLYQET